MLSQRRLIESHEALLFTVFNRLTGSVRLEEIQVELVMKRFVGLMNFPNIKQMITSFYQFENQG
jgi:hypothetical protein